MFGIATAAVVFAFVSPQGLYAQSFRQRIAGSSLVVPIKLENHTRLSIGLRYRQGGSEWRWHMFAADPKRENAAPGLHLVSVDSPNKRRFLSPGVTQDVFLPLRAQGSMQLCIATPATADADECGNVLTLASPTGAAYRLVIGIDWTAELSVERAAFGRHLYWSKLVEQSEGAP